MNTMKIKSDWAVKRLIRKKINSDVSGNFLSDSLSHAVFPHAELDSASLVFASPENIIEINNKFGYITILESPPKNIFQNNTKILYFGTLFVESCNARERERERMTNILLQTV